MISTMKVKATTKASDKYNLFSITDNTLKGTMKINEIKFAKIILVIS